MSQGKNSNAKCMQPGFKKKMPKGKPNFLPGNQFWKARTKHGRYKIFSTPDILLDACEEAFRWCDENPLIEIDFMNSKKGIVKIEKPKMRPYTFNFLTSFLDVSNEFFNSFETSQEKMVTELKSIENQTSEQKKEFIKASDFLQVITYVRNTMYNQKFTGAAAGFLKENIISRELGLSDKKELSGSVNIPQLPPIVIEVKQIK